MLVSVDIFNELDGYEINRFGKFNIEEVREADDEPMQRIRANFLQAPEREDSFSDNVAYWTQTYVHTVQHLNVLPDYVTPTNVLDHSIIGLRFSPAADSDDIDAYLLDILFPGTADKGMLAVIAPRNEEETAAIAKAIETHALADQDAVGRLPELLKVQGGCTCPRCMGAALGSMPREIQAMLASALMAQLASVVSSTDDDDDDKPGADDVSALNSSMGLACMLGGTSHGEDS